VDAARGGAPPHPDPGRGWGGRPQRPLPARRARRRCARPRNPGGWRPGERPERHPVATV